MIERKERARTLQSHEKKTFSTLVSSSWKELNINRTLQQSAENLLNRNQIAPKSKLTMIKLASLNSQINALLILLSLVLLSLALGQHDLLLHFGKVDSLNVFSFLLLQISLTWSLPNYS